MEATSDILEKSFPIEKLALRKKPFTCLVFVLFAMQCCVCEDDNSAGIFIERTGLTPSHYQFDRPFPMAPANILVTGANRGIGYGLVKKFLENKDVKRVFATARKPEEATELKALAIDPRIIILQLEVACDKSIEAAYEQVKQTVGDEGLNLLVNNAGIFVKYDTSDPPNRAELARQLDVNTISPVIITQVFLPLVKQAASHCSSSELSTSKAAIVNISSTAGSIDFNDPKNIPESMKDLPVFPLLAYRISKSGLNSATKHFANELKKDGILVACFCPGWVQTDMGGENAMLTLDQSMNDLVPTIYSLKTEHTGGYFRQNGDVIPW